MQKHSQIMNANAVKRLSNEASLELQTPKRRKKRSECGWVHSYVWIAPMSCEEILTDLLPTSGWNLRYGKKCKNTWINVTWMPTPRHKKTRILSDVSPPQPPGFPRRTKHSWSGAAFEGEYRSRTPNWSSSKLNTHLNPPKTVKGPVPTQIPPDSTAFWLSLCTSVLLFSPLLSICLTTD